MWSRSSTTRTVIRHRAKPASAALGVRQYARLYAKTDSWYTGANIPGKPRRFLAHPIGSRYFKRLEQSPKKGSRVFVFGAEAQETEDPDPQL